MSVIIKRFDLLPLFAVGDAASICTTGSDFNSIALECLEADHGRALEFTDLQIEITASAKVLREVYTHISGTSRLQASTRYIDHTNCQFIYPESITDDVIARQEYTRALSVIQDTIETLTELGIPREDVNYLLPMCYESKMLLKINLRALIHMFHLRSCNRAFHEYREIMEDIKKEISMINKEWKWIADTYFVPQCEVLGYCKEKRCCGRKKKKSVVIV